MPWVSVKYKPPPRGGRVLVGNVGSDVVDIRTYYKSGWKHDNTDYPKEAVSAWGFWHPIPAQPCGCTAVTLCLEHVKQHSDRNSRPNEVA